MRNIQDDYRVAVRPTTCRYLFCGRSQPVGITALLVTHTIGMLRPACRPPGPCWPSPGNTREPARRLSCPRALPIRSPNGGGQHEFCQVAAVNRTGLRSRERRFESCRALKSNIWSKVLLPYSPPLTRLKSNGPSDRLRQLSVNDTGGMLVDLSSPAESEWLMGCADGTRGRMRIIRLWASCVDR